MTGMRRTAVLLAVVLGMTLAGCGGASGGSGGNGGGGTGPERAEDPPDVEGTWIGGFEGTWPGGYEEEGGGTLMLAFDQDGGELSGRGTAALRGEEFPLYLHDLNGRVTPGGEVSATANIMGAPADETASFDGRATGSEAMDLRVEGLRESIEVERARTDLAEGMGLAAVQAVYSRDWVWFADHVSADVEDSLEVDFEDEVDPDNPYDELTQMVARQYDDEMAFADEEDEPPMGTRATLDEGSVVTNEVDSSRVTVEFDFETSDGRGGDADVSLVRAGTAGSGFAYQIDDFRMEYEAGPGATYDMSMTY